MVMTDFYYSIDIGPDQNHVNNCGKGQEDPGLKDQTQKDPDPKDHGPKDPQN